MDLLFFAAMFLIGFSVGLPVWDAHIFCPCPTGWGYEPAKSVEVARLAVQTGAWVLYECEEGKVRVTVKPKELKPLGEYLKLQKRFKGITEEEVKSFQEYITENYKKQLGAE